MMEMEFVRRMISTEKMNLRYFLRLYYGKSAKIKLGKADIKIGEKKKNGFEVTIIQADEKKEGYVVLNEKINGFTLFFSTVGQAVKFSVYRSFKVGKKKKARIETFSNNPSINCFDLSNYLKKESKSMLL